MLTNLEGYSRTANFKGYVVPKVGASEYYADDYILNYNNYGVIFGEDIHWYELFTNKPVLHTKLDFRIYEETSQKHSYLISMINRLSIDTMSEIFRNAPKDVSKQAIKDEEDRAEAENVRWNKKHKLAVEKLIEEGKIDRKAAKYAYFLGIELDDET